MGFDSFTLAVLGSGVLLLLIFGLMFAFDKGKPAAPPANAPAPRKVGGKR